MSPSSHRTTPLRVHVRAVVLTVVLLGLFFASVALYARFGYPFILRVYEQQVVSFAETRAGQRSADEYIDYLRIDPASIRVRDLLIDNLIGQRKTAEAVASAREGVDAAISTDRPVASLLLGRALIASGHIDEARDLFLRVVVELPESDEAWYALTRIHASQGAFDDMTTAYTHVDSTTPADSTPSFVNARRSLMETASGGDPVAANFLDVEARAFGVDTAGPASRTETSPTPSSEILFMLGVEAERSGDRPAALDRYRSAAKKRHPLAVYAAARVSRVMDAQ